MAKTTHVVLKSQAHGNEAGDVLAVEPERARVLIASGLAREPRPGEVKAAKDSDKS